MVSSDFESRALELIHAQVGEFLRTKNPSEMVKAIDPLVDFAIDGLEAIGQYEMAESLDDGINALVKKSDTHDRTGLDLSSIGVAASCIVGFTLSGGVRTPVYADSFRDSFRNGIHETALSRVAKQKLSSSARYEIGRLVSRKELESAVLIYGSFKDSHAYLLGDRLFAPVPRKVRKLAKPV